MVLTQQSKQRSLAVSGCLWWGRSRPSVPSAAPPPPSASCRQRTSYSPPGGRRLPECTGWEVTEGGHGIRLGGRYISKGFSSGGKLITWQVNVMIRPTNSHERLNGFFVHPSWINEDTHSSSSFLIPSQSSIWLCLVPCCVSQLKHKQSTVKEMCKTCCKIFSSVKTKKTFCVCSKVIVLWLRQLIIHTHYKPNRWPLHNLFEFSYWAYWRSTAVVTWTRTADRFFYDYVSAVSLVCGRLFWTEQFISDISQRGESMSADRAVRLKA